MLAYVRQMGCIKCHVRHDQNAMHKFQAQDLESEKEYNGRTVYNQTVKGKLLPHDQKELRVMKKYCTYIQGLNMKD